jgi:hypothetical protein
VSNTNWPQLDPDTPPDARNAIVEARLNELRSAVSKAGTFTDEQRTEILWLIDLVRGLRLIKRGGAWGLFILATVAAAMSQLDTVLAFFRKG